MKNGLQLIIVFVLFSCQTKQETSKGPGEINNLVFSELATTWDEAMPLGNGMVGQLVWQKNGKLRFS
ncbi:MAG: hypothetical protein V2I31_00905, partial [Mariniphaga sp.]|nr:hypothetical protein [Mariniphaga sp.]